MIQSTLLRRKHQKPAARLPAERDATIQAAATVTTMAGHCRRSRYSLTAVLYADDNGPIAILRPGR
jgi:hypothetical protein